MKLREDVCVKLFEIGTTVADGIPEIAPEIRDAISIVQNPGTEVSGNDVKRGLYLTLSIYANRSDFLSPINAGRLCEFFNGLSAACGYSYKVNRLFGTTYCTDESGGPISVGGLLSQLQGDFT